MENRFLSRHQAGSGRKKLLKPALALAFVIGSVFCTNAWADRGGHHRGHHGHHGHHGHQLGHRHGHLGPQLGHHHHGHHHHGHHRSRGHVGVVIGAPLYWGHGWHGDSWYGDPFYRHPYSYRYRPVLVAPEPPVYIERDVTPATSLWYFCSNPEGYYPYVKQCSMPWRTVTPQSVAR